MRALESEISAHADPWPRIQAVCCLSAADGVQSLGPFGVVLSFVVICALWRANVRLVKALEGLDGPMMVANLAAAGLVILVPFTTEAISNPQTSDLALPSVLYALNIAGVSLSRRSTSSAAAPDWSDGRRPRGRTAGCCWRR